MIIYNQESSKISHRTLLRTQKSLFKEQSIQVKNVRRFLHKELKQTISQTNLSANGSDNIHSFLIKKVNGSRDKRSNSGSRSFRNLFKSAHVVSRDETFLPKKRLKGPFYQTISRSNKVKSAQSISIKQNTERLAQKTEIQESKQKAIKTIAYAGQHQTFKRKISLRRSETSQLQQHSSSQNKSYLGPSRVYSHNKSYEKEETSDSTIKKLEENKVTLIINPIKSQKSKNNENQQIKGQLNEIRDSSLLSHHSHQPVIDSDAKYCPKVPQMSMQNKQGLPNTENKLLQDNIKSEIREAIVQPSQRQNIYRQVDNIDLLDIEEINLKMNKASKKNKSANSTITKNPYLPVKTPNNPSTNIENSLKSNIKIKSSPKIIIDSSPLPQSDKEISEYNLVSIDKNNLQQESNLPSILPQQSVLPPKASIDTIKSNLSSSLQGRSRASTQTYNQVLLLLQKIGKWKFSLEMHAQLSVFFSSKAKMLKYSQESKQFLRQSANFKWHRLAYLFFKYFYCNLIIYEGYYKLGSTVVRMNRDQIDRFSSQNKDFLQTLKKVEKSVRKNSTIDPQTQKQLFSTLPLFEYDQTPQIIKELTSGRGGSSLQFIYLQRLSADITDQAMLTIKSLFIGKILTSSCKASVVFKETIYRILNACSILHVYRKGLDEWQVPPKTNSDSLNDPSPQQFKLLYNAVVNEIFKKSDNGK